MLTDQTLEGFHAGAWVSRIQYKSFEPTPINRQWLWQDPALNVLLESAHSALAKLDAYSTLVPNVDLFIRMHVLKEAQTSSRIEGTQTQIDEVLMPIEQIDPEKRDDWQEIQNYIQAVNEGIETLVKIPLSLRLLKQTHATLLQGVRGARKMPGEFRNSQNWIGGSGLKDAVFIPPHTDNVPDLMGDLEKFWHNEEICVPHLIKIGISHYQFETIHPFLDGNGRIGRLMIPLYLVSFGLLSRPSLYLSDFFERHRASYYDALMKVRVSGDIIHWLKFFLQGMEETARSGFEVFQSIIGLTKEVDEKISGVSASKRKRMQVLLQFLYAKPVVDAAEVEKYLNVTHPTANNLLKELLALGILREIKGHQRARLYIFENYVRCFR